MFMVKPSDFVLYLLFAQTFYLFFVNFLRILPLITQVPIMDSSLFIHVAIQVNVNLGLLDFVKHRIF